MPKLLLRNAPLMVTYRLPAASVTIPPPLLSIGLLVVKMLSEGAADERKCTGESQIRREGQPRFERFETGTSSRGNRIPTSRVLARAPALKPRTALWRRIDHVDFGHCRLPFFDGSLCW